jgi:hypothetical protein
LLLGVESRRMANRKELEATPSPGLANSCGQISENASLDSATRDEALNLAIEWVRLQMPSYPDLFEQRKIERALLKSRMVDFLRNVLEGWPRTGPYARKINAK